MRRGKTIRQTIDIFIKILSSFVFVFLLYLFSKIINNFAYDYFVFPFISIMIVFVCGVNVGKSLERVKNDKGIGYFTKTKKDEKGNERTEFYVNDRIQIITNKKILKEVQEGDKVHIKTFNYNEIDIDKENNG